jgi:hypothetical protein
MRFGRLSGWSAISCGCEMNETRLARIDRHRAHALRPETIEIGVVEELHQYLLLVGVSRVMTVQFGLRPS